MKYYLVAGEASGDLHAGRLMHCLKEVDPEADFRFIGGNHMACEGGTIVRHYKDLAYMGFVPVLLHLPTIFRNMAHCKRDILEWKPDVVILVDYPGFNLSIAKFVRKNTKIPVYYYISPKIWAWKEWRIKAIRRDIRQLFSILPFEKDFFEGKHHYPIHYVGNPTAEEVTAFRASYHETFDAFCRRWHLDAHRPIIALLAGSRKQEIKDNLNAMVQAAQHWCSADGGYQMVVAGAPSIDHSFYNETLSRLAASSNSSAASGIDVRIIDNDTYALLSHATAALVTSGTATLETALFNVPQVVCYKTPLPHLMRWAFNHIIQCKFISLVNLIADREVVDELMADRFSVEQIRQSLQAIMPGGPQRQRMLDDYKEVKEKLGEQSAPHETARLIQKMWHDTPEG